MGLADRLSNLYRSSTAPHTLWAALGLGALIMVIDNYSTPAISPVSVSPHDSLLSFILAMPFLIGLYAYWTRTSNRTCRVVPILLALSVLASACAPLLASGTFASDAAICTLFRTVMRVYKGAVMFLWLEALVPFGAQKSATAFGFGAIVFAALSTATLVLREDIAEWLVGTLPLVSVLCLLAFKRLTRNLEHSEEGDSESLLVYPCSDTTHNWVYFALSSCIPLVCFAIAFGEVHFAWVNIQDGSSLSFVVQVGTLFGSIVGGCIILLFVLVLWTRENIHILKASLPMVLLLALWFSSSQAELWVFAYLTLLNITQKMVYLLMWLTPFMFDLGRSKMMPFCLSYLAFEVGKAMSTPLESTSGDPTISVVTAVALSVLILCSMLPSFVYNSLEKHAESRVAITRSTRVTRFRNAIQTIAERYELTPRETELMLYLGKGFTSASVADKLCISNATAKTHQKNIYTKLKVHSQQDLLLLIDATMSEQYEREATWG